MMEPVESKNDVPEREWKVAQALLSQHPPSNPAILLNAARWWYMNGRGGNDPAYRYAVRWLDYTSNGNFGSGGGDDTELFADLREYLVELSDEEEVEA